MKHIIIFLFCICSANFVLSQDFEAKDIKFFPGEYNSHENFHIDQQNNYFVAGRGTGEIDLDFGPQINSLPSTSFKDLYLAKYNSNGDFEWVLSFEGSETVNQIRAITSDNEGNIYIGGAFSGSLSLTDDGQNDISSFGATSMFLAKFDTEGNLVWQFTVGDTNFSQYPDALFISDDRLIVQFVFDGSFDIDPGPNEEMLDGDSNAMLVYGLDGAFIEAYSHRGGTVVRSSVMDSEGNIYLSGLFSGLVSLDYKTNASIITNGFFDAFVVKYDKNFNKIWHKRVSKSFNSLSFYKMSLDINDDLIIGAALVSEVTVGSFETANDANYLINISKDGDFMNLTEILPESSFINDIVTNSSNQVILSGNFSEVIDIDPTEGVHELTPNGGDDIFLAVYDQDYNYVNSDQISSSTLNTFSIHISDSDNIYILTDFEGEGKCVLGSSNIYTAESEENFVLYKLDIDGCSPTEGEWQEESCEEVVVNGESYTESGIYQQFLTNAEGCDSTLNITVVIHPVNQVEIALFSCGDFEFDGQIINTSGTYNFVLTSSVGCDSLLMIDLSIIELDKGISLNGNELIADESEGDSYQWYDCDTDEMIPGANLRTFVPEKDGSYKVEVNKGVCIFSTPCVDFMLVNTKEIELDIKLSPNPTDGIIYMQGNIDFTSMTVSLFDVSGREIKIPAQHLSTQHIDLSSLHKGVYWIRLQEDKKVWVKKIMVY